MKFTIFTSFYNYLETFDELVEGVFSQTYDNWEWLVADDFSSDPLVSIKLKELAAKSSKVKIVNPSFKKEFYWNPPMSRSTGDIFMVYDSDDMMYPKLLEVYKHNFEKFPEVNLISTNSIILNDSVKGTVRATRHINYGKNCNAYQSKNDISYEYNWGDCRAWRNTVKKFSDPGEYRFCAEDVLKITTLEEFGKILYLPRTLHDYAFRESSISHTIQHDESLLKEADRMFHLANLRKNRDNLNSIHDHYDRAFAQTTPFYLSAIGKETKCCTINFISPKITPREKEILKDLYFDHDLLFNSSEKCDYLIGKITDNDDLISVRNACYSNLPKKQLVIEADKDMEELVKAMMSELNIPWRWFRYTHFNVFCDL